MMYSANIDNGTQLPAWLFSCDGVARVLAAESVIGVSALGLHKIAARDVREVAQTLQGWVESVANVEPFASEQSLPVVPACAGTRSMRAVPLCWLSG
ncbi:hypothetical protein GCM10011408_33240 [Dyella caseinilytica]|nr:hypothetical protein GCM10011408_33240 [Dyella caseinilytica]